MLITCRQTTAAMDVSGVGAVVIAGMSISLCGWEENFQSLDHPEMTAKRRPDSIKRSGSEKHCWECLV